MKESIAAEQVIVYPLTELRGDDIASGNYIRPANFGLPGLCDDCPLKEKIDCPQISKAGIEHFNIGPRNPTSIMDMSYMTNVAGMTTDVLLLHDASDDSVEPVVLQEMRVWNNPLSVQNESAASLALGAVHERFDDCEGPIEPNWLRRILRQTDLRCGTGAMTISAYNTHMIRSVRGARVIDDRTELMNNQNVIVGEDTPSEMDALLYTARARKADGRPYRDATYEEDMTAIETMMKLAPPLSI